MRRSRLLLLAGIAGLVIPVAIDSAPASAVDQDLQASVAAGPAGTEVELSSASCVSEESSNVLRVLSAQLISGTAPDEVVAGIASGFDADTPATLVVPDWIDPADPAVIEATCLELDLSGSDEPTITETDFDPIAFDVEPSADAPVQARTFSRTSMQAGQGFALEAEGCFLDNASYGGVDVASGDDLTGRGLGDWVASGYADLDDDAFEALTAMTNASYRFSVSGSSGQAPEISDIEEIPTDIPAGTYTALPYCGDDNGTLLLFEPELLEITGDAPFADIDLTVPAQSRTATLTGGSCTVGDAEYEVYATSLDELSGEGDGDPIDFGQGIAAEAGFGRTAPASLLRARGLEAAPAHVSRPSSSILARAGAAPGPDWALADEDGTAGNVTPDASGAWSFSDDTSFDAGIVDGYALCGDPLADGFLYDPQVAAVQVDQQETTTTTTVPAPAPAPANAVPGTPSYAG